MPDIQHSPQALYELFAELARWARIVKKPSSQNVIMRQPREHNPPDNGIAVTFISDPDFFPGEEKYNSSRSRAAELEAIRLIRLAAHQINLRASEPTFYIEPKVGQTSSNNIIAIDPTSTDRTLPVLLYVAIDFGEDPKPINPRYIRIDELRIRDAVPT